MFYPVLPRYGKLRADHRVRPWWQEHVVGALDRLYEQLDAHQQDDQE